ncbi:MAG TPA: cellulose synthase operon protein YhjQ/BcsQ [Acidimicrobiales bacterium]|nr:cellulose synthase operon protein YhjQ/BcsQ [Acidimicrobiales bacterium]
MLVCWSVGGGVGTSVVVAGLAVAAARAEEAVLVADLGGDQPLVFGAPDPVGPGVAQWLGAAADVGADALRRLEVDVAPGIALLPRGDGELPAARAPDLLAALEDDDRFVVVDAGVLGAGGLVARLVDGAARSLLVARACPITLARLARIEGQPTEVVVVRDRRRSVTWHDIAEASGAPVVAELEIDPAVAAAVDAGLERRALPRSFVRVLGGVR